MNNSISLLQKLASEHRLSLDEYQCLIDAYSPETARLAASLADNARREVFGNKVYIRGLIEISSFCRCDCSFSCCEYSSTCENQPAKLLNPLVVS